MIAEIFPQAYDTEGRPTFRPDQKRRSRFPSTFPFGSYVSQPLAVKCNSLEDLRVFLRKCRYVSDEEQFGKKEYWMPPQDFERSRKGDCEDFSLMRGGNSWTWDTKLGSWAEQSATHRQGTPG